MSISIVGILYVVATPIGNLQDLSLRAVETLKKVALIVAEDTRHCKVLLKHYGISTAVRSLHEHNEREQVQALVALLLQGQSLALISDAGTPLISDPGYYFVQQARAASVPVSPIPGPCALIAALSASGLPTDKFVFEGFLPMKAAAREKRLASLCNENRTLVFYEAPHRIVEVLQAMQASFGKERRAVLAREMTKIYETLQGGTLQELLAWVESDANQQRGEMVLLVEGAAVADEKLLGLAADQVLEILSTELPLSQAVRLAAALTGKRKNQLYKEIIK